MKKLFLLPILIVSMMSAMSGTDTVSTGTDVDTTDITSTDLITTTR